MSKLVTQPSFRAVGQTHAEWQQSENPAKQETNVCRLITMTQKCKNKNKNKNLTNKN